MGSRLLRNCNNILIDFASVTSALMVRGFELMYRLPEKENDQTMRVMDLETVIKDAN